MPGAIGDDSASDCIVELNGIHFPNTANSASAAEIEVHGSSILSIRNCYNMRNSMIAATGYATTFAGQPRQFYPSINIENCRFATTLVNFPNLLIDAAESEVGYKFSHTNCQDQSAVEFRDRTDDTRGFTPQ
jgi:hypothetical protein